MPTRGRNQEINEPDEECLAINFVFLYFFNFGLAMLCFATQFPFCFMPDTKPDTCTSEHFYHKICGGKKNKCLAQDRERPLGEANES